MSQHPMPSEIVIIEKSVSLLPQKGHSPEFLSDKMLLKFCIKSMLYALFFKNVIINVFKTIGLLFHFLQMLLCIFFAVFFQLLYMALLMDNCSYKLFFVGIFNSKNLPIFLLRRFMPLFIIALSTLEVNDFQPMRITPAYAGKSCCSMVAYFSFWDHPRLCGEKRYFFIAEKFDEGSPPRMRGKAPLFGNSLHTSRITPAYAGKSHSPSFPAVSSADHPRVCGEKRSQQPDVGRYLGSPPRIRGKELFIALYIVSYGITPAYAGKSGIHHVQAALV